MNVVKLRWSRVIKVSIIIIFMMVMLFCLLPVPEISSESLTEPIFLGMASLGNFEPVSVRFRPGPGENGAAHRLRRDQSAEEQRLKNTYGFNQLVSDEISLNRSLLDTREPECRHWSYPTDLPAVSLVVVFHNEGWSTLLRTVHSVINRTPEKYLQEIILVDDKSDLQHTGEPLESALRAPYYSKVRLLRNQEREGLIRSRNNGAQAAVGEVLVFLDAHCEVNTNWLPPLLAPILADAKTLSVPVIDPTENDDFRVRPAYTPGRPMRGIFEWGLLYKETQIPAKIQLERTHKSEPYPAPTHAGGLFAIRKDWFSSLGWYDPGLLVWGGENYELSFKVWMCGGRSVFVPCSRVAHVYRKHSCSSCHKNAMADKSGGQPYTLRNYKRVVETWFDDKYKEYFYTREPLARLVDMGDISSQLEIKSRLECKSFDWFMKEVAYDVYDKYPAPPPNLHYGSIQTAKGDICLDTFGLGMIVGVSPCHNLGGNQLFRLNTAGKLSTGEFCIHANNNKQLVSQRCAEGSAAGPWKFMTSSGQLYHTKLTLCVQRAANQAVLGNCDEDASEWTLKQFRPIWTRQ